MDTTVVTTKLTILQVGNPMGVIFRSRDFEEESLGYSAACCEKCSYA